MVPRLQERNALVVVLLFVFVLLATDILLCQPGDLKFEHLTTDQGLSQNSIYAIVQDRTGFMWFGTHDGLDRFDGSRFRVFRNDPNDSTSISDNIILALIEGQSGHLWIGTSAGLNRFDPISERFTRYLVDQDSSAHPKNNTIRQLLQDRSGRIWVGTLGGVYCLDPKTGRYTRFLQDAADPGSLSDDWITALLEDRSGQIWIGTRNGLNRLLSPAFAPGDLPPKGAFQRIFHDPQNPASLRDNGITGLFADRAGTVWVAGMNFIGRLLDANASSPRFEYVQTPQSAPHQMFYQDDAGDLWIRTWGDGIAAFNPRTRTFTGYRHNDLVLTSLSNNTVTSAYVSREGILWAGTSGGGLNKVVLRQKPFKLYRHQPNNPNSLANKSIRGIYESPHGILWIGGYRGLDRFNRKTGKITHYQEQPKQPDALASNSVRVIYPDPDYDGNVLWLGLESTIGVQRFDVRTGRFRRFPAASGGQAGLGGHVVFAMLKDRHGRLWVGTIAGLKRYDERSGQVIFYTYNPARPEGLGNQTVIALYEDRAGNIWIGTDGGLDCLRNGREPFLHYRHDPNDPHSLSNNRIKCIYQARDGAIWIGTDGGGLNRLDTATGQFRHYRKEDGLPNDVVYGILEDERGHLWLSTNLGLSQFDPQNETFFNYGIEDGLQGNEFNSGSYFKSTRGEMFFGGLNGITAFFPQDVHRDKTMPPVVFTAFKKLGTVARLDTAITAKKVIELTPRENVVSFEFQALSFVAPEKNRYAYRLEGVHNEWIDLGNTREVTFSHLSPGKYVLHVRGSNHDGVWNKTGASLTLIVLPPFWQRWWFRGVAVAAVLAIFALIHVTRMRAIRERNARLQKEIDQRLQAEAQLQRSLEEVRLLRDRLQEENTFLRHEIMARAPQVEDIAGESAVMKYALYRLQQFAPADTTVLLLGETGTGKELFARAVHQLSPRKDRPLVKVNCATLPKDLIESELFGHEKGAFTGAQEQRIGRFELADGGTIFLDEIGELPLELQAKLLRVLQEGEFERLGGTRTMRVDVRVIAATNRDLQKEMQAGRFREDLYYRLNVFTLVLPPLRERKEDIPLLLNLMLQRFCKKHGKKITSIPQGVLKRLQEYDWPGNVRELENVLERAVITSRGPVLRLLDDLQPAAIQNAGNDRFLTLDEMEKQHITAVLEATHWRIEGPRGAATILNMNPATLRSRMKKLNISRPQQHPHSTQKP